MRLKLKKFGFVSLVKMFKSVLEAGSHVGGVPRPVLMGLLSADERAAFRARRVTAGLHFSSPERKTS